MEKKESPKKENNILSEIQPKIRSAGFSAAVFGMVKFILGVCLLPFVYSTSVSFLNEFALIEKPLQNYFWTGIISFLLLYLFVFEPLIIYTRGQRLLEFIFGFLKPLVKVAPYLLPIYTLVLFILYGIFFLVSKSETLINGFIFLFGFSIGLHLVFSSRSLRSRQGDFLKGNYIFGFSFVYIVNLILLALGLNFIFAKFSFVNFCNISFQIAKNIFYTVFKQLFLQ